MYIKNIEVKVIKEYPEYAASKCGKIFRVSSKKEIKQGLRGKKGREYLYINTSINNIQRKVNSHILIALAWVDNPDPLMRKYVNHKDGNKINNVVDNLEWVTHSQNQRHAVDTGLKGKGNSLYNSELTDEQVHDICKLLVDGARPKDVAVQYKVSPDIIRKIRAGDTYFHVRCLYHIALEYRENFSDATVKWICERIKEGHSDQNIVNISSNKRLTVIDVKRIRYKIRYKYISDLYF